MNPCRVDWGVIVEMEDDLRNLRRLANVLITLGTHDDSLDHDSVYVVGCFLHQMGERLEAQFDALQPVMLEGRR